VVEVVLEVVMVVVVDVEFSLQSLQLF